MSKCWILPAAPFSTNPLASPATSKRHFRTVRRFMGRSKPKSGTITMDRNYDVNKAGLSQMIPRSFAPPLENCFVSTFPTLARWAKSCSGLAPTALGLRCSGTPGIPPAPKPSQMPRTRVSAVHKLLQNRKAPLNQTKVKWGTYRNSDSGQTRLSAPTSYIFA